MGDFAPHKTHPRTLMAGRLSSYFLFYHFVLSVSGFTMVWKPWSLAKGDGLVAQLVGLVVSSVFHVEEIRRDHAELMTGGVGERSVRLCRSVLHRPLEKAVGYGLILSNPAAGITLPQYKPVEIQVRDDSQVSVFLIAAENSRFKALYHLAVTTGMRQGELFGLKWVDLHWNSGSLQVQRQVQRVPQQGWSFLEPKSRAGRRTIQLG